jgi:ABC-type amino acid transport substrate-binding protein
MHRLTDLRTAITRWQIWVRTHPRLVLVVLTIAGLLLAHHLLTRPGAWLGRQDTTWHRSQVNKDLYVGLDPNYPPFAEWTPDGIVGLEADIAREIGRRLGVETQILIMGYDGLYDSLFIGTVDFVIAGLRVDPGQSEWVYYTRPYFDAGQILVSRADSPIDDMRQLEGKMVAVELASAGDLEAQRWTRRLGVLTVVRFMLPDEAMRAVQMGDADAALVDTVSARLYLDDHPDLVMAPRTTVSEGYVIALRRNDFRMADEVDKALAEMIKDGTLDEIIARWL